MVNRLEMDTIFIGAGAEVVSVVVRMAGIGEAHHLGCCVQWHCEVVHDTRICVIVQNLKHRLKSLKSRQIYQR